jgi:hypothetical protein
MKKYFGLVLFVGLFVCSCASQKSWVYSANNYSNNRPIFADKSAVVLPFKDSRENINKDRLAMFMIPIIPGFGWANYNVPEGLLLRFKPSEDYPKALAEELTSAGIFNEAYFDFKKGESDFIIKGEILLTKYTCTLISYGLSVFGPNLWIIGFPSGTISNEIVIKLSCVDNNSSKVFFSKTYAAPRYKKWAWIYAPPIQFNYSSMLKDLYKDFTEDLKINLQKQARIKTRN